MTNQDITKLVGISVVRGDIVRWLRWNPSSVIAAENKRIFNRSADGRMSAFDVINYALTTTEPGSAGHNYALSWAKYLLNGERDEFYPLTEDEKLKLEEQERERRKTPEDRYAEASYQAHEASELVNRAHSQIAGFKRTIEQAEEGLKQWKARLVQLEQSESEALQRKAEAEDVYQRWFKSQQAPAVSVEPEPQPLIVVETTKPRLPAPQVERKRR